MDAFTGEIQLLAFSFAPAGSAFADGSILNISQYNGLFALYGTSFGGNGVSTFALPNLASQQACGNGQSPGNSMRNLGALFGSMNVALDTTQMPAHTHNLTNVVPSDPTTLTATPATGGAIGHSAYGTFDAFAPTSAGTATSMSPNTTTSSGSATPHENRQPFLGLNYSVVLNGSVYPQFS